MVKGIRLMGDIIVKFWKGSKIKIILVSQILDYNGIN